MKPGEDERLLEKEPVIDRLYAWMEKAPEGTNAAKQAAEFVELERKYHNTELGKFAHKVVVNYISVLIHKRNGALRRQSRQHAKRKWITDAAEAVATGESVEKVWMIEMRHVVADHRQVTAAEMFSSDHLFVAERYGSESRTKGLLAMFHKAIADKIGDKKTSDVYTPEQYEAMYRSIVGQEDADPNAA